MNSLVAIKTAAAALLQFWSVSTWTFCGNKWVQWKHLCQAELTIKSDIQWQQLLLNLLENRLDTFVKFKQSLTMKGRLMPTWSRARTNWIKLFNIKLRQDWSVIRWLSVIHRNWTATESNNFAWLGDNQCKPHVTINQQICYCTRFCL